jgi:hypothetical protein
MKFANLAIVASLLSCWTELTASDAVLRFIRSYGGDNEQLPPVVLISEGAVPEISASAYATVEFDIQSPVIPNLYARLIHCSADWNDDGNSFLTDITTRTTTISWSLAPQASTYYSYRGKVRIPNPQIAIRFSGNWKVKVFDMDTDELLGETRIFAVDYKARTNFNFMTDFYEPKSRVSSIALTLEAVVTSENSRLMDPFFHTVTFYRNHRWSEPFIVSTKYLDVITPYGTSGSISGIYPAGKVFRISRIPAQNEYRVLDMTNLGLFPYTGKPVRLPLSDLRRNGSFFEQANDGAMITAMVQPLDDIYVPVEFLLDPQPGSPSVNDVFIAGSFNNWTLDRSWMMSYDEKLRLYRLRQWVRRGRHNYLYATGSLNIDDGTIHDISFEEFEGNTASNTNSYIAFVYYRVLDYGGYDAIISVAASNIYKR